MGPPDDRDSPTRFDDRAPLSRAPLSLVVMSPTGTGSVLLPQRGTLVLGRASECDVKIDDAKLSRKHAELRCGETLELVDLDSRNGTYLRDQKLPPSVPHRVRVGDSIAIGSTVLVVQGASTALDRPRHVWTHGYFEARLEEECARAAREGAGFAILCLQLAPERSDGPTKDAGADAVTLLAELEHADMLASYAPHQYEALFTGTTPEEADARASALERSLADRGAGAARVAVATFPRDGRTPEALIEHTTRALRARRGAPDRPAAGGPGQPELGALARMDKVIERVAAGIINVLLLGETGVGKDVLARRLHERSPRAKMPLVSINCAALSETLLESELFGYEKGAFTGALAAKQGLLESANGGVVFLDEIGEMPLATQAKILRAIEQREVTRVGALRPRTIDVRFFSATNRDLEAEIARGRFRQDLYFRLNGIALSLPPLRERVDEIEPLACLFLEQSCRATGRTDRPSISRDVLGVLRRYQWPGNIRELKNVVERAVLLCSGDAITLEHLPLEKMGPVVEQHRPAAASPDRLPPMPSAEQALRPTAPPPEGDERSRILEALERCAGSQSNAAKLLGISRATLIRRLDEYRIARPRKRDG
jgi:DNA-binding NtrC family response regulator